MLIAIPFGRSEGLIEDRAQGTQEVCDRDSFRTFFGSRDALRLPRLGIVAADLVIACHHVPHGITHRCPGTRGYRAGNAHYARALELFELLRGKHKKHLEASDCVEARAAMQAGRLATSTADRGTS